MRLSSHASINVACLGNPRKCTAFVSNHTLRRIAMSLPACAGYSVRSQALPMFDPHQTKDHRPAIGLVTFQEQARAGCGHAGLTAIQRLARQSVETSFRVKRHGAAKDALEKMACPHDRQRP